MGLVRNSVYSCRSLELFISHLMCFRLKLIVYCDLVIELPCKSNFSRNLKLLLQNCFLFKLTFFELIIRSIMTNGNKSKFSVRRPSVT